VIIRFIQCSFTAIYPGVLLILTIYGITLVKCRCRTNLGKLCWRSVTV